MDYNKIPKIIKDKKYLKTHFIEDKIGMSLMGFNQTIKNGTLKVRDLEKISKELGLPMYYWWAEEDLIMPNEQSKIYGESPGEIIADLRRQIKGYVVMIENLNKMLEECQDDTPKKKRANSE